MKTPAGNQDARDILTNYPDFEAWPLLMSIREVAQVIRVSTETVRWLMHEQGLPYIHVGRGQTLHAARVNKYDLVRWLEARKLARDIVGMLS